MGGSWARPAAVPACSVAPAFPRTTSSSLPVAYHVCLESLWNDDRRVARLACGCFCRSQTLCTEPGSRHAVTHGQAWNSQVASRQASPERKKAIRSWISVVYMGGSIPRWQSRLGEEGCSYPRLPIATSVQPGGADGEAVDGRPGDAHRSSTAQADISHSTANLAEDDAVEKCVMRWRFPGAGHGVTRCRTKLQCKQE